VLINLSDIITNINVTSKKILSIFLMAVLLGSITTFSSYAKSNDELSQGNGILQNPQINKVLKVFTSFVPVLKDAQAIDNSDSNFDTILSNQKKIQTKHNIILNQIVDVKETQKEILKIKKELNSLGKSTSLNSKKITTLNKYLSANTTSLIKLSTELVNTSNDLTSIADNQISALDKKLTVIQSSSDVLNGEINSHVSNIGTFSSKLASFTSQSDSFIEDLRTTHQDAISLVKQMKIDVKNNNTSAYTSDLEQLLLLNGTNNKSIETFNGLTITQKSLESEINLTVSQIKDTSQKTSELTRQMKLISTIKNDLHRVADTTQDVIKVQTNSQKSTNPNPFNNGALSVQDWIVLLQNQINALKLVDIDIQNQIDAIDYHLLLLDIKTDETNSRVDTLDSQMEQVLSDVSNLQNDTDELQDKLQLASNIMGIFAVIITSLGIACAAEVATNFSCSSGIDIIGVLMDVVSVIFSFI
jgi:peptidoglycan hydrolase CwlO-like protein